MNKYHKIDSSGFTDVNTSYGFHGRLVIIIISGQSINSCMINKLQIKWVHTPHHLLNYSEHSTDYCCAAILISLFIQL